MISGFKSYKITYFYDIIGFESFISNLFTSLSERNFFVGFAGKYVRSNLNCTNLKTKLFIYF